MKTIPESELLGANNHIGHGAFGDVHERRWKDAFVALKMPKRKSIAPDESDKYNSALALEYTALCGLNHANVLAFLGVVEAQRYGQRSIG